MAEWNSAEVTSCRGSSQCTNGCVDDKPGFGEEDDSDMGEVRKNLCWCSVYCEAQVKHDAWMTHLFWHTIRL